MCVCVCVCAQSYKKFKLGVSQYLSKYVQLVERMLYE